MTDRERFRLKIASNQRFLLALKTTAGCVDCGTVEGRLDFDHRPGVVKRFQIARRLTASLRTLLVEIEKCDVRCMACHLGRHRRLERQAALALTHCSRGHEFSVTGAYFEKNGRRRCRACALERARRNPEQAGADILELAKVPIA